MMGKAVAVANRKLNRLQQKSAAQFLQFQDLHAGMSSAPSELPTVFESGEDWGDHGVQPHQFNVHFIEVGWKGKECQGTITYQGNMTSTSHTVYCQRFTESLVLLIDDTDYIDYIIYYIDYIL